MEQTALRPKPMPGRDPGPGTGPDTTGPCRAGRRRRRRLVTLLLGVLAAATLVLAGVGLGTVGATVIGMSKLAEMQRQAGAPGPDGAGGGAGAGAGTGTRAAPADPSPGASPSAAPAGATLGVEAVDDEKPGARVVGVHVPGPGYAAGLVRGDVLLTVGTMRVDSAADLARAVARAEPGEEVKLTVRHRSGGYQQLTAVPGVVT
ncbi:PDZ domain-containing protein [Streptomyces coelicoflavus]|uniref:PDZ domain-containing protein n=1 Tax=Streptomyces coelicoflavus TaxID=285562 RepID=UPI0024AE2DB5|nr:PDZ domain-containing protein [Streptomyces coelicoflavus]MDI6516987.1 PDZ domain-containing protein [Streptomyces coelicoflavus]